MKILILGPSGSGKTYLSSKLKELGANAIDADEIIGLSSWFDGAGNKVAYREDADEEFLNNHSFLWNKDFLREYLNKYPDVYIFGVSGNAFEMLDLFDQAYFLEVPPEVQRERLMHPSRKNPMGQTEYQRENAISWAQKLANDAKEKHIPFIDATLRPEEILNIIKDWKK